MCNTGKTGTEANVYEEVDNWLFMGNAWTVVSIVAFYLYFIFKLGPKMMENRKPFSLKYVMVAYNLYQVVFSLWLCSKLLTNIEAMKYLLFKSCKPANNFMDTIRSTVNDGAWWYFFSKIVELLDTVFFVLRKKQNQITVLHVYHHANMVISTWAYLKYIRGEQGVLVGCLNSFVHVVMYSYYLLAALGPSVQKYLWWKKYITKLQLGQFIIVIMYLSSLIAMDCKMPKFLSVYMFFNAVIFLCLFTNFYRHAYIKRRIQDKEKTS